MKQKPQVWLTMVAGLFGMIFGLALTHFTLPAKAAPLAPAATGALANLFDGKTYPLTLKAEQIDSSYHLVGLVDAQGSGNMYATRGETVSAGSETFLVCYNVPTTKSLTKPPQPKADAVGEVIYINLHAVQAMGGIIPIAPPAPAAALPAVP